MVELLVAGAIFLIVIVIAAPQFTGTKKQTSNMDARNLLNQAYESSQDYFEGESNPCGNLTYAGINKDIMKAIQANFEWIGPTNASTSLGPNSTSDPKKILIWEETPGFYNCASGALGSEKQQVVLCNATEEYIYCAVDKGTGPKYGVSKTSAADAFSKSQTAPCNESPALAESFTERGTCARS